MGKIIPLRSCVVSVFMTRYPYTQWDIFLYFDVDPDCDLKIAAAAIGQRRTV